MLRFVKEVQWLPVTDLYFMAIHGRGAIFNSSSSSVLLRKLNFVFKSLPIVSLLLSALFSGALLACETDPVTCRPHVWLGVAQLRQRLHT